MKDRGRVVSTDILSGKELKSARISSNGRSVEVLPKHGDWYETFNAGSEIDELILEDNGSVTAVLANGQRRVATVL